MGKTKTVNKINVNEIPSTPKIKELPKKKEKPVINW